MDRFLLAEKPMHPEKSGCFILHTIEPEMLIEVHHEAFGAGDNKLFFTGNYENKGVIETITFTVCQLFPKKRKVTEELKIKISHAFERAWRWYVSYLKWEDESFDEKDQANFN